MIIPITIQGITLQAELDLPAPAQNSNSGLISQVIVAQSTNSIVLNGLNGDVERAYRLVARIKNADPNFAVYDLRPNGLSANMLSVRWIHNEGGTLWDSFPYWLIGGADSNFVLACEMRIFAGTGMERQSFSQWETRASNRTNDAITSTRWSDTVTNIIDLEVHCDQSLGIGAGSEFLLYKL